MPKKARPKAQRESRRFPLNLRTTREMRDQLELHAKESGRSLIQEIEFRLEQSFQYDVILRWLRVGPDKNLELVRHVLLYIMWNSTGLIDDPMPEAKALWWCNKAAAKALSEQLCILLDALITGTAVPIRGAATEMQAFLSGEYKNDSPARVAVRSYLITQGMNLAPGSKTDTEPNA
jgi:hypothetical protein